MNIKEVRSLLTKQTEKVNQLKQELKTAEEEQARLTELEKKLNQDYQEKIRQATELLKEAQTIADFDQETVFSSAWTEYEKDRQPTESELAVLQQLKDQLKIFTELNKGLPEEDQIVNKQRLLTLIDGGVTQPVNEPEEVINEPKEVITQPINEPLTTNNKLEEIKKAINIAMASVTIPELKKVTASLGFTKNVYQSLESYLDTVSESDLLQLISKFIIYVPDTKEFFNLDYSIDIKTIRTIEYADIPLDKLELSAKIHAACLNFQIKNVGLLIGQMQYNDGRSLNVGVAGRKEIREKLINRLGIIFDSDSAQLTAA
ncbi:hypothetical protein [Cuspidothrix issatschenkoi]|uniref:Uncharacterized protein n=1 Tax=Cuspidothrix issatschenkoi CHARLIE-1 TaxID=2052836 RepID=A0A2S6CZX9_9CYAN|nr:hypothetical protein [Cuspidothrix issatschenkoi]PPJ65267.1 hypothetical protein CUN59_00430 [Cuspidothrix issatschenkoi CHARLIE-1]